MGGIPVEAPSALIVCSSAARTRSHARDLVLAFWRAIESAVLCFSGGSQNMRVLACLRPVPLERSGGSCKVRD